MLEKVLETKLSKKNCFEKNFEKKLVKIFRNKNIDSKNFAKTILEKIF